MTRFSANLGFLWAELALPDAIRAAGAAGFDAVECHWPYDVPAEQVRAALEDVGLQMLGLNTAPGMTGQFGLSALPDQLDAARGAVNEAIGYARRIGARNIHVMAGKASGDAAHAAFIETLRYAAAAADAHGLTVLIEPLNPIDAPGYFLSSTAQAVSILDEVGHPALKLMFDCYHVARTEGDVLGQLRILLPWIGHIQIASVPDRAEPDEMYRAIFELLDELGWDAPIGAEYKPKGHIADGLAWMTDLQVSRAP